MTKTVDSKQSEEILRQVCDVVSASLMMKPGMVEPVQVVELLANHLDHIKKIKGHKPLRCTHGMMVSHWFNRATALAMAVDKFLKADGHDLCHENRIELGAAIGVKPDLPTLPPECEFAQRCIQYRQELYGHQGLGSDAEVYEDQIAKLKEQVADLEARLELNRKAVHDAVLIADGWRARADGIWKNQRDINEMHQTLMDLLPSGDEKIQLTKKHADKLMADYNQAAETIATLFRLNPEPSWAVTPEENVTPAAAAAPAGDAQVYSNPMVDALNDAFARDPVALAVLLSNRVPCNADFAENSAMICEDIPVVSTNVRNGSVGALGLLNGCLHAAAMPRIASKWDEADEAGARKLLGFCIYDGD